MAYEPDLGHSGMAVFLGSIPGVDLEFAGFVFVLCHCATKFAKAYDNVVMEKYDKGGFFEKK